MEQFYLGFDNGLDGGIAALDRYSNLLAAFPMPTLQTGKGRDLDIREIETLIRQWPIEKSTIVIEAASKHSPGKMALCSTWRSFGVLETLAVCTGRSYHIVAPRQWQRQFWSRPPLAAGKKFNTKAAARAAARRLWPHSNWLPSHRSKKPHDGMIDAALIAEYARRSNL